MILFLCFAISFSPLSFSVEKKGSGGKTISFSIKTVSAAGVDDEIGLKIVGGQTVFEPGDTFDVTVTMNNYGHTIAGIAHFVGYDEDLFEPNIIYSMTEGTGVGCSDIVRSNIAVQHIHANHKMDGSNYSTGTDGNFTYYRVDRTRLFCAGQGNGYTDLTTSTDVYKIQFKVKDLGSLPPDIPTTTILRVLDTALGDGVDSKNTDGGAIDRAQTLFGSLNLTVTPDATPPVLQTFHSTTTDGTYMQGGNVTVIATYDEPLATSSQMTVVLDSGGTVDLYQVDEVAASNTMKGIYTVGAGEGSADLTVNSITTESAIDLYSNTQASSTVASTTSNIADTSDIKIDGVDLLVEFNSASASVDEDVGTGLPTLSVIYNATGTTAITQAYRYVDVNIVDGTATLGSNDYATASNTPVTVTIPPGNYATVQTIQIQGDSITSDNYVEGDETIDYSLSGHTAQIANGDADGADGTESTHTYTILNDDELTVAFTAATSARDENDTSENTGLIPVITVSGAELLGAESVQVAVTGGSATGGGDDYNFTGPTTATLTLAVADYTTAATFTIPTFSVVPDSDAEGDEDIDFQLQGASTSTVNITGQTTHTHTIVDDDLKASISLKNDGAEPGTDVEFYIYFNQANTINDPVRVTFEYIDETATGTIDYNNTTTFIDIPLGNTTGTLVVPVIDDDLVETGGETFSVHLLSADNNVGIDSTNSTTQGTITDDDTASFTVSPTTTPVTEGNTTTFSVVLDKQPKTPVIFDISSDDIGAATVDQASLTFTNANWDTAQYIVVTAEQDTDLRDETPTVTVDVNNASSNPDFAGLSSETVTVNVTDDDSAGYTVTSTSIGATEGATTSFTVVLGAEPTTDVVFDISSDDVGAASVSSASLTFTSSTWNTPQTIIVTAEQDDDLNNESPTITVAVNDGSSDDNFDPLSDTDVNMTVTDDDSAGFTVTSTAISIMEGSSTGTFTVVLDAQPNSDVVFGLSSDDTGAATIDLSVLTFTTSTWDTPQVVTLTGEGDDDLNDENVTITVTVTDGSSDDNFDPLGDQTVAVSVSDDDTAGYTITPTSTTIVETNTDTFDVALTAKPNTDVVITVSSTNPTSASVDLSSLTFTSSTWSTPQTVTITAEDEANVIDEVVTINVDVDDASSDDNFDGLTGIHTANTTDDDKLLIEFTNANFADSEASGGNHPVVTFGGVVLAAPGTVEVTVVTSTATGAGGDYTFAVDPLVINIPAGDYTTPSTTIITGLTIHDDSDPESNETITFGLQNVSDTGTMGIGTQSDTTYTINDDDLGVTVSSTAVTSTESGTTSFYQLFLTTAPTTTVTVNVIESSSEISVSPSSVNFNAGNWSTPQEITVTAVDDDIDDGDQVLAGAITHTTVSAGEYNGFVPDSVTVTTIDDDTAGVTMNTSSVSAVLEEGETNTSYTIVLDSQPTTTIYIDIATTTGQVNLSTNQINFTTGNWSSAQTITVTAIDDSIADGTLTDTITHTVSAGTDQYTVLNPLPSVIVTETDNDTPGITFSTNTQRVTEGGGTDSYTVVLDSEPLVDVVITLTDTGNYSSNVASLTFTPTNWNITQTVTTTGSDDAIDQSGSVYYATTTYSVAAVGDANYNGFSLATTTIMIIDDEGYIPGTLTFVSSTLANATTTILDSMTSTTIVDYIGNIVDRDFTLGLPQLVDPLIPEDRYVISGQPIVYASSTSVSEIIYVLDDRDTLEKKVYMVVVDIGATVNSTTLGYLVTTGVSDYDDSSYVYSWKYAVSLPEDDGTGDDDQLLLGGYLAEVCMPAADLGTTDASAVYVSYREDSGSGTWVLDETVTNKAFTYSTGVGQFCFQTNHLTDFSIGTRSAETVSTPSSGGGGGGISGGPFRGDFSFTINDGREFTNSRTVTLKFDDDHEGASHIAVSNDNSFPITSKQPFVESMEWTLTEGTGLKTVYAIFYDNGRRSDVITSTIRMDEFNDIDKDGDFDIVDFTMLVYNWGHIGAHDADLNGDNRVDIVDFTFMVYHWTGHLGY